jgi:hypothetical protein
MELMILITSNLKEIASTEDSTRFFPLIVGRLCIEFPNLTNNLKETFFMVHFGLRRRFIKWTSPLGG